MYESQLGQRWLGYSLFKHPIFEHFKFDDLAEYNMGSAHIIISCHMLVFHTIDGSSLNLKLRFPDHLATNATNLINVLRI